MDILSTVIENPYVWVIIATLLLVSFLYLMTNGHPEVNIINSLVIGLISSFFASIIIYTLTEQRESLRWKIANDRFYIEILNSCNYSLVFFLNKIKQLPNVPAEYVKKEGEMYYKEEVTDENRRLFCRKIQTISKGELNLTIKEQFKHLEDEDYLEISKIFEELERKLSEKLVSIPNRIKAEQYGYISEMIRASSNLSKFSEYLTLDLTEKGMTKDKLFEINIEMFNKELQKLSNYFWKLLNSNPKFKEWKYLVD